MKKLYLKVEKNIKGRPKHCDYKHPLQGSGHPPQDAVRKRTVRNIEKIINTTMLIKADLDP